MKNETKARLFEETLHYWIVKLDLKYIIIVKQDNRLNSQAETVQEVPSKKYTIRYNVKLLTGKISIISAVLHEIGHLFSNWNKNDIDSESDAEFWALDNAKIFYPKYYRRMVNTTLKAVKDVKIDLVHQQGYLKALQRLGEI
jgi:hypothetical protein